jgi:uncharacterized protein
MNDRANRSDSRPRQGNICNTGYRRSSGDDRLEDQSEIVEFLSRAETYGAESPVLRRETHAAIVFLAGPFAYKLKRAVRYSYLDYSTVSRRRAMCEAELAVNRRTAPDLYVRVQPIVRQDGRLALGSNAGAGRAVDWLVVMRRFAESDLLEQKLGAGEMSPTLLRELAEVIAGFHASAERTAGFGGAAAIARTIAESKKLIGSFEPHTFPEGTAERFGSLAEQALAGTRDLLDRRAESGFVRRCHGDLHLNNICIMNGHPVLFDAIEFNDDFSNIDVFYDLAFLLMALDRRGSRAAANIVLNRYLELTSDYGGVGALPLLLACRASVRAHVDATAALRLTGNEAEKLRADAASHAQQALDYLSPRSPELIAIGGISGTGKSLLARNLAPQIGAAPGAVVLRSDVIRKRRFGVSDETRLPRTAYSSEVTDSVYAEMRAIAELLLRAGQGIVADAVHGRPEEAAEIEAVAQRANARFSGLWLDANIAAIAERLVDRSRDASDAGIAVARRQMSDVTRPAGWMVLNVTHLDATACAAAAARILNVPPYGCGSSVYV